MNIKVKALVSFFGEIGMNVGEVREIPAGPVADSLIAAGYVEVIEDAAPEEKKTSKKKSVKQ